MCKPQTGLSLLIAICIVHVVHAVAPFVIYESYGPNLVFLEEGQPILSPSGKEFVTGVTKQECARLCYRQNKCTTYCECDCCNSFAYKGGNDSECYLKKRFANSVDGPYVHPDGFQSFEFWPFQYAPFYTGNLPETVGVETDLPYYAPFQSFYSTKGDNQVAIEQGSSVFTNNLPYRKLGVSASQCATDCEATVGCEGFSYNPYQQGGMCYLKTGLPQDNNKYNTKYSEDGWTFYWKEQDYEKCYCSCQSGLFCLHCYQRICCDIVGKLSC